MRKLILTIMAAMSMLCFTACGNADSSSAAADPVSQAGASKQETQTQKSDSGSGSVQSGEEKTLPAQTGEQQQDNGPEKSSDKDTIVVYFSATGTTKGVAERIASAANADIFELIPSEPYSDADLDWNDRSSRTTIEMNDPDARPAIANDTVDLEGYKTVYIGYPIWWGEAPRMMSTFVEAHSFEGKTVIPFCTSGSSPIGRSGENLASQAGSGNWLAGGRLNADISESEIQEWINGMN